MGKPRDAAAAQDGQGARGRGVRGDDEIGALPLEEGPQSRRSQRAHAEDEPRGGGEPVTHPVAEAPERGCPVQDGAVEPAAQSIEGGMYEIAEVIDDARLGAERLEGGVDGVGGRIVSGAVAGRQDEDSRSCRTHLGKMVARASVTRS